VRKSRSMATAMWLPVITDKNHISHNAPHHSVRSHNFNKTVVLQMDLCHINDHV